MDEKSGYKFPMKLFVSLMMLSVVSFVYQLVRTNLVSDIPDVNALGIAGHIEWFDLIDETLQAFLIMPLYALFNRVYIDKDKFRERIGQTAMVSFVLYTAFSVLVFCKCSSLVAGMGATLAEVSGITTYLQLETIGFVIALVSAFASVLFVIVGKSGYVCALLVVRVIGTIVGDLILIPNFGVNGVAVSNIAVNTITSFVCVAMLAKEGLLCGIKFIPTKDMVKEYACVGVFSGGEIFLNNVIYALIVCKMINAVAEQGNYWVANNVIWGFMLIPVNALSEIIKKDCAGRITGRHLSKYGKVLGTMFAAWVVLLLVLKPFLAKIMGISDVEPIAHIIYTVIPFYVAYAASQVFNSVFIGKGKTQCNLLVSIVVNLVYYPIVYILVKTGVFSPSIEFICYMFGVGMLLGAVLGFLLFWLYMRRDANQINTE